MKAFIQEDEALSRKMKAFTHIPAYSHVGRKMTASGAGRRIDGAVELHHGEYAPLWILHHRELA